VTTRVGTDRLDAGARFFTGEAERLARLCHQMSERFAAGGRLLAVAASPAAVSDAHHIAVEFVHPVIVGKRALPALAVDPAHVALLTEADDIVVAFEPAVDDATAAARERGCLTIGFGGAAGEWRFDPASSDAFVAQEVAETAYHLLWELVHVFFEHRSSSREGTGASSFLYPFLGGQEHDVEAVIDDVRRSVLMKADEIGELRAQTLGEDALPAAARALRASFDAAGKLLTLGNGGSATDAADAAADFRDPPAARGWPARPAVDLSEDPAILTAIANDIGTEAIFARQVIAYGRAGDALLALSTSGNSENVIAGLGEARRRGLVTIAMVGYDGGRVASESLADHVVVTRSEHIPRIQEAQASAYHVLRELVEESG
jgi:D-sedoheptulose 7-phosphate isomerase